MSERLCKSAQVVKERLQVQSALPSGSQQYRSSFDALGKIWWQVRRPILVLQTCPGLRFVCRLLLSAHAGRALHVWCSECGAAQEGFGGIYRGYMATLYSFGPFSAFYFGFYEQFKATAAGWHGVEVKALPMPSVIAASALAGSGAAWLSSPLDMIKLRIQVQRRSQEAAARAGKGAGEEGFTFAYRGMLDGLGTVLREEGARALWKGAATRVAFMVPNSEWCSDLSAWAETVASLS